jgi:hypothetical protein
MSESLAGSQLQGTGSGQWLKCHAGHAHGHLTGPTVASFASSGSTVTSFPRVKSTRCILFNTQEAVFIEALVARQNRMDSLLKAHS